MIKNIKERVLRALNPLRRRVPFVGVLAIVRTRSAIESRIPSRVAKARREMEHLMGAELTAQEIDALAPRYLRWDRRRGEYRWHQELVGHQRVHGLEHLEAAQAHGRGVLVTFLHHAHFDGSFLSLKRAGVDLDAICHPLMIHGGGGNYLEQHAYMCALGSRLHSTEIGSAGIAALLEEGRTVCIALDVAGSANVTFLGKQRRGSSGPARIATKCGSPVVVMTYERDGDGVAVRLHEPVDPADHATPEDLLTALLARHEDAVRAFPESYDQPVKRWGEPLPSGS